MNVLSLNIYYAEHRQRRTKWMKKKALLYLVLPTVWMAEIAPTPKHEQSSEYSQGLSGFQQLWQP